MLRAVSEPRYTRILKKSVGHADSHLLHPTQSSVLGDDAIWFALHSFQGTISNNLVKIQDYEFS